MKDRQEHRFIIIPQAVLYCTSSAKSGQLSRKKEGAGLGIGEFLVNIIFPALS